MCLHCSLEINIPALLRWHSVLEFVINAGTVQQWHSSWLFASVFLTIFAQAVVLFHLNWAAPWQYCAFCRKAWPRQTKSLAHKWIVTVGLWGTCSSTWWQSSSLTVKVECHHYKTNVAFKPQSPVEAKCKVIVGWTDFSGAPLWHPKPFFSGLVPSQLPGVKHFLASTEQRHQQMAL